MKVKINDQLICISPYISATWDQISFLQSEEEENHRFALILHLSDGKLIRIPNLDVAIIEIAFAAHLKFLEQSTKHSSPAVPVTSLSEPLKTLNGMIQQITGLSAEQIANLPIRFGIALPNMEGVEVAFQHNQAQAHLPDMPAEVLEKILNTAQMLAGGDLQAFPKPEPHCNCMHCQVGRVIHQVPKEPPADESVSDTDLAFRDWEIEQQAENLYSVTHPLEPKEKYSVFLGTPVGCTCGEADCEHIKAVLRS